MKLTMTLTRTMELAPVEGGSSPGEILDKVLADTPHDTEISKLTLEFGDDKDETLTRFNAERRTIVKGGGKPVLPKAR